MTRVLNMCGTFCPEPVLAANRVLNELPEGAELVLLADDPVAEIDITHFCRSKGHCLLSVTQRDGTFWFRIRRATIPAG
jgi:tRNA 2-thiouridine synthesizing protein A